MSFNNLTEMLKIPTFLRSDPKLMPLSSSEIQFFGQIKSYMNLVKKYEDFELQEKARNLIPWKEMTIKAINKMLQIKQNNRNNKNNDNYETDSKDILLIELLDWFKNQFFRWFDSPDCDKCNIKMTNAIKAQPLPQEIEWSASNVELYKCDNCGHETRFARYNNPEKLLETRTGRCGEFANCFTLMCRSLNFDARFVLDWTDHVWTEVYSNAQKRWLHCDPCENICDSPLVYECGWNKKLSFCIGISHYEVQDVSWRYSKDHNSLKQRRALLCREDWVANLLNKITDNLQIGFDEDMKQKFKIRRLLESVEFIKVPDQKNELKDNELEGRHSGSKEWRIARKEISPENCSPNYKFNFSDTKSNPSLITYNCSTDEYKFNGQSLKEWRTCVYEFQNIFRKVERDWKMAYLSRNESSANHQIGTIKWLLNFNNDIKWSEIRITIKCAIFENGSIRLNIYSKSITDGIELKPNKENIIIRSHFPNNQNQLTIEASLEGGNGSNGWQHSQLFRQSLKNELELNTFVIEILF
jgi:peptide-N4-(N-acetyl-beta-glucosaminyl)asparagine amidase